MTDETTGRTDEGPAADQATQGLAEASRRGTELEQALIGRESEIAELKQGHASLETRVTDLTRSLAEAVAGYRAIVVEANPGVPAELITGDSVAAIGESLEKAQALVKQVRRGLEADAALSRFPAGAPERASPVLHLSPREKIEQGILSPRR